MELSIILKKLIGKYGIYIFLTGMIIGLMVAYKGKKNKEKTKIENIYNNHK